MEDNYNVLPSFNINNVPVLITSSDLYAPYMGVLIQSIIKNASDENNYDILIFETDISDENKAHILSLIQSKENFKIRFVDISETIQKYSFTTINKHHQKYNYDRLAAFDILTHFDKVLYLDSDIVANGNIAPIMDIELGENYVAATKCIRMQMNCRSSKPVGSMSVRMKDYLITELKMESTDDYFNSGVMLLNLKEIRKKYSTSGILQKCQKKNYATVEQDVLNILFEGKVYFLSLKWNLLASKGNNLESTASSQLYIEYLDSRDSAILWHYAGNVLPCKRINTDRPWYFWKYAYQTPFYKLLLERLKDEIGEIKYKNYMSKNENILTESQNNFEHIGLSIFVSHRCGVRNHVPSKSIYKHMQCGYINHDEEDNIVGFLGDDTGDHISEKSAFFNELTVQYWAWKNHTANFYGLCHYRRYFSFSDAVFPQVRMQFKDSGATPAIFSKYQLNNEEKIEDMVKYHDAIVPRRFDIKTLSTEEKVINNLFEFWSRKEDSFDIQCYNKMLEVIKDKKPEFFEVIQSYMNQNEGYFGCVYILNKDLFNQLCEFQFTILFELEKNFDMSHYEGEFIRQPAFMGEILYGAFIYHLKMCHYRVREQQVVLYGAMKIEKNSIEKKVPTSQKSKKLKNKTIGAIKKIMKITLPSYRTSLRLEKRLIGVMKYLEVDENGNYYGKQDPKKIEDTSKIATSLVKSHWNKQTLTSDINLNIACLANEIRDLHTASFLEFKNSNMGKNVVIVATGPTLEYYNPENNYIHIGVNASFKRDDICLDYYFTTDYEGKNDWFEDLKNYDFIKFFGQYSSGTYRDRFQVPERIILENNGRRFFQGAPSEDIHLNIEYYPLVAFYSIAFQALHFSVYTNPKRIFLVGCDCSGEGYFDGSQQRTANPPKWVTGYKKMKMFVENFYPETEIISINPIGLRGIFRDVYTEDFLATQPELDFYECERLEDFLKEDDL